MPLSWRSASSWGAGGAPGGSMRCWLAIREKEPWEEWDRERGARSYRAARLCGEMPGRLAGRRAAAVRVGEQAGTPAAARDAPAAAVEPVAGLAPWSGAARSPGFFR